MYVGKATVSRARLRWQKKAKHADYECKKQKTLKAVAIITKIKSCPPRAAPARLRCKARAKGTPLHAPLFSVGHAFRGDWLTAKFAAPGIQGNVAKAFRA